MNNEIFNPYAFFNYQNNLRNNEIILSKLERLEKDIRILENRLNILEKKEIEAKPNDKPTDMYMI